MLRQAPPRSSTLRGGLRQPRRRGTMHSAGALGATCGAAIGLSATLAAIFSRLGHQRAALAQPTAFGPRCTHVFAALPISCTTGARATALGKGACDSTGLHFCRLPRVRPSLAPLRAATRAHALPRPSATCPVVTWAARRPLWKSLQQQTLLRGQSLIGWQE